MIDFGGRPSITVATVDDLTDDFAEILQAVLIKAGILFLVLRRSASTPTSSSARSAPA